MGEPTSKKGQQKKVDRGAVADLIIDGISDALMLLDATSFRIVEANKAFERSYGISREEAIGLTCHFVTHRNELPCDREADPCPCPVRRCASKAEPTTVEHVHYDSQGHELHVESIAYPLEDETGKVTHVVHLSRDVSDQRALEKATRDREKLEGILELSGAASHEINQPITVLLLGLRALVKRLEDRPDDQELAQTVLDNVERLREVSKKLSRITRYSTTPYVGKRKILDLDKSSA